MAKHKRIMGCGCVVALDYDDTLTIVYCPKHKVAEDMYEALKDAQEWLSNFVMRFYTQAEQPSYEAMKALYQELDTFQRVVGAKALAKAEGK